MEKMISYIFGSLEVAEKAIGALAKDVKKQKYFNKYFAMFAVSCIAYAFINEEQRKKDNEKIESLTKEVEEMKKMKGE